MLVIVFMKDIKNVKSSYKSDESVLEKFCGNNEALPFHEIHTGKRTLICLRKDLLHSYLWQGIYELTEDASKKQNLTV